MSEPVFIKIVDYSKNEWFINIKHIFEIILIFILLNNLNNASKAI